MSTADYEEIYSGPGGVPRPGWDSMVKPTLYSNYYSVAMVTACACFDTLYLLVL